jgi:hypothetical protein
MSVGHQIAMQKRNGKEKKVEGTKTLQKIIPDLLK